MTSTQRLELTWIGKNSPDFDIANVEPRILIEDPARSFGDRACENLLIHGDNLLALKALLPEYEGKVKCVFIDPPYNTGSAFTHYDDGVEHSTWLSLIRSRLEILRRLLSDDGSLWITIDDNEAHYLKVMCDEVFGRSNFVSNVIWQKKFSPQNDAKWLSNMHDHVLVYAANKDVWRPRKLKIEDGSKMSRGIDDGDPRGKWLSVDYTCNKSSKERPNLFYSILNPNTNEEIWPKDTAVWRFSKERHAENVRDGLVYWGKNGTNKVPRFKNFKTVDVNEIVPSTVWLHQDVGNTQEAKKEATLLSNVDPFSTPKPERLIKRILDISTSVGDLVLDSFAGSGTTGAVAHKMGRRWIMVELGEHCYTHIIPRIKKVISGDDHGGISEAVDWKGGGGYKLYELARSFVMEDEFGMNIIDPEFDGEKLVRAVCKLLNYAFRPDAAAYYKHGVGTGKSHIYVTTQMVGTTTIRKICGHLRADETLVIAAKKFEPGAASVDPRVTIKKIPQSILKSCQYGKKDYLLPIRAATIEDVIDDESEETCYFDRAA